MIKMQSKESKIKTASVRVSFIQIMQVRVQNKGKSVWKSRYIGDVLAGRSRSMCGVIVVDAESFRSTCCRRDAYIHDDA